MDLKKPAVSRRMLFFFGLLALFAGLTLMSSSSTAHPPPQYDWEAPRYRVTLEDEFGQPLPAFRHEGERFVLGGIGDRYRIRVENPTARRVEAVVSVDGRDAVSGGRGDYTRQRGYVIAPYGSVVISGFRQSLDNVATFRFTTPEDSYSGRMGTIENTGVIGVAFFAEAERRIARPVQPRRRAYPTPAPTERAWPESRAGEADKRSGAAPRAESGRRAPKSDYRDEDSWHGADEGRLGTEYGESRESRVVEVPFRRRSESHPESIVTLRYDDRRGLIARGIDLGDFDEYPSRYVWGKRIPDPFPDSRFAPPPP